MSKIGYNISLGDLGGKYQEAQVSARIAKADMHLVMTVPQGAINTASEIQEVTRWHDALVPAKIIWRTYSTLEGDWLKMLGYETQDDMWRDSLDFYEQKCRTWASTLAARWHVEGLPDVIRDDPTNEPGLEGSNQKLNERYVIRCVELQKACDFYGVKVAIGAFSVGMPHESLIDNGTYDPILRIVKYLSVHEYPAGIPGAGDLFPYEALLEPETLWGKLPKQVWETQADKWLLRRCDRAYLRAKSLGNDIEIIVTETNTSEDIPDAVRVNQALKNRGLALPECGGDLRGHQAWRKYYEKVTGDVDFERNVGKILEYMANYVFNKPYIIGVCLYQFGQSWGKGAKGRYRCHNHLGDDGYQIRHNYIPDINNKLSQKDTPDMPVPIPVFIEDTDYVMESATLSTRAKTNIRRQHDVSQSPVIQLNKGDFFPCLISDKPLWAGSGDMWYRVKAEYEILWVADTDNLIRDRTPKPDGIPSDVPDTPDDSPDTIGLPEIEDMVQQVLAPLLAERVIDIPLPAFTMTVPEIMIEPTAQLLDGLSAVLSATAKRLRAGTPTASQIADEIYATVELDDVHATNLSGLPANEQLDVLNGHINDK